MSRKPKEKDYDLVKELSIKYAESLKLDVVKNFDDDQKARIGFYYLGLEMILGISDFSELSEMIVDTDFQKKLNDVNNNDLGIDAVYVNESAKKVSLFSFKYRNEFSQGSTKSPEELRTVAPFIGYLKNKERFKLDLEKKEDSELSFEKIQDILSFDRKDPEFELYMITNDCAVFDNEDAGVNEFIEKYPWIKIKEINLEDLADHLTLKAEPNNAELTLNKKELLQHDMDGYTTANSYVGKIKLTDLIKITSKEHSLRKEDNIDDAEIIKRQQVDLNVLFDNVRGFLGETKHNDKILKTLEEEPEKFFLFNNGITITASDIVVSKIRMDEFYKIQLTDYQIVNGGQTLRSIYYFKDNKEGMVNNLAKASVLVRFFKTGLEEGLVNKVSEYTNSQNAISGKDLKSVDKIQLDIETRFKVEGLVYLRKMNKVDKIEEEGLQISMEKLGQLLLAFHGHPEKVSNSKKKIFEEYYNYLFNNNPDFMDNAIELTYGYHDIISSYQKVSNEYKYYEQKVFYIVYLNKWLIDNSTEDNIEIFEKQLEEFRKGEDVSPARKLLQIGFKEKIDSEIERISGRKPIALLLNKRKK
ncbi:AIPR family protein [Vagococcus lutrae]|uniref:AIPR family protein n=1 Tax=Vagococcus lutrae TaxID=81947 RepID=UPI002892155A|nr:AIPR family protein [Vagococcus lutrae]MDT2817542.1 AIPR family protein [Vagococcus lutrae]